MVISKASTLFLNEITCVDHAFIDNEGRIKGGSFLPSFLVSGPIEEKEKVVVDFSTIKKDIKALIDAKPANTGFDHKLWIIDGWSKVDQIPDFKTERVTLKTPCLEMDLPMDAVKVFSAKDYATEEIGRVMAQYLTIELRKLHDGVSVACMNSTRAQTMYGDQPRLGFFRYVHGLKDSSSWGCQNIAHGHLSFLQFDQSMMSKTKEIEIINQLAQYLDDTIFVNKANVVRETKKTLDIGYSTCRGEFFASYNKNLCKVRVLDTETTVEYLIDFVVNQLGSTLLKGVNARGLFMSEGLSKGSYVQL